MENSINSYLWANLKDYGGEDNLNDVEIKPKGGQFKVPQQLEYLSNIIIFSNRIREVDKMALPSEEQQNKIVQEIYKRLPDSFLKSDVGQYFIQ